MYFFITDANTRSPGIVFLQNFSKPSLISDDLVRYELNKSNKEELTEKKLSSFRDVLGRYYINSG
ncbi:MAG: hypothetical protein ACFB02_15765 [Mastigocoleus sp.]